MDASKMKTVYTVVERGGKSYWSKMGVGFVNRDGSINIKLDGNPINGTLQVRDYEPREDRPERSSLGLGGPQGPQETFVS